MEDTNEEYLLKWNSHHSELVAEFLDLCKNEEFTDVTISADDETFEAHKLILSACSPYFRALLNRSPCRHPVIYLNDVSADHVATLLKYMYVGQIAVKKEDLNDILRTADQLRIRGLTTSTNTKDASNRQPQAASKRPIASAAVISEKHDDEDENGKIIEAGEEGDSDPEVMFRQSQSNPSSAQIQSNGMSAGVVNSLRAVRTGSRASQGSLREGRKGYLPKKIRMSEDTDSIQSSSPHYLSEPGTGHSTTLGNPMSPTSHSDIVPNGTSHHMRNNSGAIELHGKGSSGSEASSQPGEFNTINASSPEAVDNETIGRNKGSIDTLTDGSSITDGNEEVGTKAQYDEDDQPMDFSKTTGERQPTAYKPKFSILSSYLKTGKMPNRQRSASNDKLPGDEASISKAAESLAASWLEQSLTAMQTGMENEIKKDKNSNSDTRDTINLRETLGIDIADRLRSHFLSNMPTKSMDWFNSAGPNKNSANAHQSAMNISQNVGMQNGRDSPQSVGMGGIVGNKPSVTCEICGKKLADPSSLYRHRKIHSGDKPHKCPYCTRRFIQRYNMKQHIKTHRMERMTEEEKAEYLPKHKSTAAAVAR